MKITFDKKNYRKHSEQNKKRIRKSLTECGAGRSVLVDKDGCLIAGNGVYEQAEKMGIKTRVVETDGTELVVVKRTDIGTDDPKRKTLALADNATSDNVEWDLQNIVEDFDVQIAEDWGINVDLSVEQEPQDAKEDDFDEEKDPVATICQEGDVWQLCEHRLMCGDSTKAEDVARLMNGELADLWLTDPPYNVEIVGGDHAISAKKRKELGKKTIQNDKMSDDDFFNFLHNAFDAANGVQKEGCSFYIWFTSREHVNFELALNSVGLQVREELIWNKNSLVMGRQDYQWKHEPCLYGWKEGAAHNWYGDRKQTTVIDWDRPSRSEDHPTMKPIGLFGYQISNSSKQGDIVLDTFGGAGTTIIAAEQLGRKCYMMELDPHYCDVIIARWEKLTGQKAIKL